MKNIFIAAVVLFLFAPVFAQTKMTDREFDNLKGKVKSVTIQEAEVVKKRDKEMEEPRNIMEERYYDKSGNIIKTLDNVTNDLNIYTFIDGDKTYKKTKTKLPKFTPPKTTISGRVNNSNEAKPTDERYTFKFKYKYDAQGRVIEEKWYLNTGILWVKSIYEYDDKGRMIKESYYDEEKLNSTQTYKYDDKGIELESIHDLASIEGEYGLTVNSYNDYQFDVQGNWVKRTETTTYKREGKVTASKTAYYRKITYHEN